ncbi:TPA: hyperosmolarity resistance protein Ebh, partial [Staphylococcus aureus]|nr:hyperosmolarity resistance protein Ebh [Staphylococcus aureus]
MNYRDKIQKFSIRKYTVGTFSTVIATLVFLGFNTSQAHAAETNQPASVVKQKQQSNNEQTENRESQVQNSQNSQNGQSLSATHENEQPNINQTNHVDVSAEQSSTTENEQAVSQNKQTKKDTADATPTQSAKAESKHEQNESRSANKKENDNKAAHVENHEANVVTASDSPDNGNVQHDRNELQAFFDANYHDYRFIDRENADSGTFNYVKGIFDKINTLLGSNDPINNKDLQLAYKELEQAVALIRTMPQRQQTSRRSSRIQTRSVESRAAEPRSVSSYQNADSSYYVENANDGSGYPVGTYINASNKGAPFYLPTAPWNTLKASAAKEIVLITAKQTGDGYQWVIKFNKGHAPHENMIFWFALPSDQVPVGRTDFVTVNADGTNVQWSNGAGAGAYKPLPQMWPYGVNDSRSRDFKIRNRSGQVIYDWTDVHVNTLRDLARAGDYFSEAGAPAATKAIGEQTFRYINGERPTESPGASKVYTFIGAGDASYTISFKTQGPTTNKLYYAAGGRALEYNQLFMYSQLYVESTQDHQQRLDGFRQVVNRSYRLDTTKRVEVSQGNIQTKKVLESTNLNIDDFMDDPLSYVKTPSNKVLGFYPTNANPNAYRHGGTNPLNEYQLSQLFTDDKLQQAARTGNPIRLMIGFDYPDGHGNAETLVPVNLTVLPEIQHNIKFYKNDDTQNIADKPASRQAGHPIFYVYAGNQGNASVNLGGSVTSIQPLRINLTSSENFTDRDWQITGIPRTLHIENSTNRPNNARERNIELVGNLLPGDYFGTIRFGRKEQLFEIRVKPHTPTITTTAEQLRGTALQKVPITVTNIPLDPSSLVYIVYPTDQTRDGGSEADQMPSNYSILATGTPDGVHNTITIQPKDYTVFIPPVGKQIRALIYYNKVVASNMSNAVTILPDDIPPTINNPVGLNAKYYRGDEVNFTMGVSDRHSGIKNTTITTLPNGWTSNLTKADKNNGSLSITGRVSMNQAFNSDITFKVSATDNVNNTTNDSQSKHVTVHVGKISEDAHPIVLANSEKVVVVNPTSVSNDEKQRIITAFMNKNQNIRGYLASSNPVTVDNNGNVTLHYRDGSSTTLDATNVMTYEPVVKPEYQTANAPKTATVTIAKGQSFSIGDIKQYFTLSNGQAIPNGTFTNITSDRTIPTAQEVSQMNAGTQLYHIVASNAYHKDTEDLYISLKIIDVKQPEGDQRVYRTSTYDLTTDEISKVKQAFINANRDAITFAEGDISVTNTPNGANVSTVTVNINKGRLTKSFTSNLANMNFLRWVNFPQDYTVSWTNAKIASRPTDGGLSWSDDHKSLIYRYDATLGTPITTNDILTMLKATTTVPGLRNNIAGNEKTQAEAGGRPNYRPTGYSQANASSDGQRQYTLNGQVIQVLDIINPTNGFGGQTITNSNVRANHSNSTVVSVNEPAANGAGAFTIDHVVKNNTTHNAADAVYKAQLYLSPYGPKQYVEHLNQNTGNTTDAINIYFVPSDLVNPTISVGNYANHQVFSGETFTNTITANDNFGVQSVTVPNTSQITGTVDNNHQHVSATAPNVTSATNKTINLVATDTSGNTATTSYNVTIKPLRDKYRVGTSSTAANPVRIANISNNAIVSQADQTAIINSLTFTETVPNRSYARASANEITSKTVSNVSRTGNNANVTVTVTYQDGTTSTVTVPVKHVIPEIVAHSHYTVQGQDFPAGNGSSASDYFKLSNGSAIPDATITWVSGQAPNKDNTRIGEDITVTAHILIDGETTPITKTATYKVVRTVPKHVFETDRGVLYPGVSDMYDAKQYVKPVNNSWSTNAQNMNFQFVGTYGPNKDVVGISTRLIRITYDNRQTEELTILSKVKPDPPRIDGNSVTYKAGLTNQEVKVNNVLSNSTVKLFKADNTPLNVTNIIHGSGYSSVVTVSDALPNGGIKAKSSISMNNVTYTTQDEHGQVVTVTRNESVDSNDSASVTVTPQLQATTEGAVFIKGGDGFDFGHVERFIQNPPHGATVAWHDNPDTWKNTVGNTHKTAVVTLPSGQGTRNVEVPVKVYPVANAKALSRDVKGQNLTNGTDAMSYITFDPNTNTNGITAAWANRQQPNNQQAGVQHLNVDVTYPGISAAKRVPVTVNVYQFEFPQTTYTTTVGGTLASGTQASGYAHMQNATGLPTDGFTYKWNNAATGTNDANWAAMNKPNAAKVVNAKYDVIYNGHTFATSLPAKFVVKDVQPAKPTVTETAAGAITIAPGANQTVNTHAGNVTTYADKLVIKRNGSVVTTFTRHNNTSPWVKEASATNVTGIVGTNNGITVAAGTFNPADTIQVVATQGSGETISDEQRSDDFTVVAPQPNQATTKIWQNGHIDITPNNPSGHLINPTQAMDIAYTEKVGNGAEHSKTINVVRGQNNQWTIANKPDYVTLDAQTGKVTFNANTIKPNSAITITPKAGTGHSASSNPSTLTAPAAHTVNTTEIVKDYGSNVTASEINNAVQVANKRTATIKNGTAMPTNLAGGSTTTIPVTVTYNDGSTEEVQESIFTKADKRELITAKNHLDDPVSTDGKKPGTITQYNNAMHNAQQQINAAKTEAQQVINNERATPQQVNAALSKVQAAQTKINEAKALLQNKEDNSQLVTSKNNLQSSVNQVPSTAGMTQQSIDNYNAKKREAESEITAAQRIIDNGDATAQQISDEKHRVDNALTALNQAKHDLTADTHALEQAVQQLNRTGTTTGKKPASITAYNNSIRALQSDLTSAKNSANAIIQKPIRTVQEVQSALTNVNRVNERLTQAINQLVPLADNSTLRTAKTKLDEEINKSVTTDGMTQSSIQAYENAKRAGQTESTNAQNVINNGDATDQQIAAEKAKVEEKYNSLKQAIAGLTPDLAPLQTAKTQLQNDIDQPTSTTGMTSASVATFNEKLSAARTKIQEINRVLASHPDVATIRQNVTAANAAKSALDQARNGLTVDKAPLENAKNQLQHSIDTQTSTTGMTQDSINAYNAKLTAARNKIQQINQVLAGSPTVDQINTNTSAANQAKSDLDHARQALTPDKTPLQNAKTQLEQSINQPTDTTGMTTASLNAYNQKLQAARQKLTEINQVLNGNPTVQNINDKVAEANQAKDQLNTARQGLTLDRQPALTTLHGASNLNQAQQNNFTQQINAAQNHAALETIKSNITALNTAMTKLKESVADNNSIKSGQNYTDATQANKQAYDNAVNAAKGVIGETNNPTMDVNTVNQKAASVKSTKDALDGQQNLQRAKTEATNAITHASDLNQAQKNALTQQVNSAQNVQAVNNIKQTTQSLNTAMTGLKRGVANHNQVVQSDNYVNADTNKKNDYNNAYNHANDIINGNPQHPVITPSDVNNALSNVTSKEHALNGEAKLNTAKQEANTALGQLNNLNNAQRQNLQSQINGAHQIETVNTIKQNATNLNSAMGNLRHAVADKEQVKRTEDYADADTAKQNAYNSAVSSAETIINQSTNPTMSVDDVNRATSAVTTNKTALNGDEKLAQSKTDAARAIDALPHLNNAQKADVKSKINAASNIAGVNTVKQQGTDLNTAMGNLQGAINDEQTTLNSQNYQDATPSKKTAYTNAVQAAKDILNKSNGQNKTKDQVTEAMNQVNSAKNNLDGTRLLDQAKQTAKQQLNNMTHLTTAQKTNLTNQINSGTTVAGVHTVQSNANTLDQAMNTLRQSIANKDATKASEDYVDANNDKQTAYNNAVAAAETIINANSNPEMNPSTITQKAEQVNSSKTALNGDENLATAKQNAKTYLNTLTSITDAQKNNLISQISSATRVSGVDTVKQNAQHLDQAMASLQNGINNESQVKSSEKYRDADTNKQQEYDNAITAAKAILNKSTGPNTAQNAVEAALQRVNTAKDALNGDAKLIAAQNAAKQHLGTLTHITTAQRNDLTNQISQATNLAGVESVKQSANSLDGAMGNLQTAINDKSGTLASQNFLDADEQKRNAYNQAVSNAETILNKQTGPNTAKTAVEQALNNVNSAKHALNGTQNLNNAKQAAITAINGASDLNQKQKDVLKAQANGAQRVSNAQDVQRNATELNTAMGTLKHAIADKTNTLASSKYVNADSTKQNAYTTKVTNAEHIISGTPTVVTTPSEVTAAANQVNSAKQELNGDERLRVAKQNANTAIDALTQLNTPQKAKLKEQVGQANRLEDVQTVQTNGQSLNNAMKGLRDSIANETTVKASQNYTDASPNNQSTYNSAVSNAKGIINQTNNPTMDTSAITQATTQVNNAKNGLNGAENLRNAQNTAKQNLNTLSHLTNNQKSAISSQIDRAGHVSEVTAAKNAATELNTQMGNLEQAIHDQNTVKQSVNFTDADKAKRDAYTNAVSRAETILNKTQGANTSKQDVEAAIQSVTSAKNALNGDQNVTNAKNTAKHALNNLTSINNAQKRNLTTKIDQATTVAGVEAVSNTGTQLNTAMANLQNGINDKTNTLASENYHDADSDKKTAYTQAVTNAENILNKNSGSNLDKVAVENALSQVTNAKGALNGNHNLEQAKSNANTTINGLQHLTTAQKDKLKQQVQQAQNVAGVDTVKSSANTLNGAMGTLRNSIQDNTGTKNGQNYLDATESNKTNYNNAVDRANGVINATSNPNMDANAINQIATQVTSTKNALDGTHNLTQAKQTATNAIDGATNLNKAQKDALKAQVTSAQRVANVTSIQQTANELNTAMGQLQHGIDDENATKQTQKYRDAEQNKKTAYDQAVAAAKAILNKQTGSNSDKAAVDHALQQVTSTKDALNGDAKLAEAKAAAKQNLGTLNHITNAQRTALEGQINQATTVDGVNTVKTNANTLDGAMNSLQGSINDKDATLRNQNYLDADESKRNAYTQAVTAAEGILNKQTGGNTSKADVDNALNAVTRAKAALNGADNLRNAKTSATNTINGLPHLTQLQKDNLKHQVEQAQNVAGVNGVKDKGNTLNTAMGALRTSIQNDNTTKTSQNYLDASDSNKNNYNTAVNNANGVINATNNPNMDANAINGMANQVNTTKAALNGAQNLAQAKTNATNTINNAHDLNQKQKDALKTQVNNAQRVSDANNVQRTATELNSAMTALKAAIADKERTKASGNYVNADQEKRQAYDSKVTNAENIISGTPNATLTVNDVNSAASQVNAAKTALNGDNNLRVAKEHANNTIDGLAQLNNAQKAKLKEQVQSATTLDGVQTVKNSSQTLNTAMKGLRDSIANEATIKAGQNYTDASPNNRNEYDSAVTAAKAIINQTSNPTMEPNTITQATSQVTTKEHALNGAQNLAQAKTTAKNNLNNLTSINNAQKDALTRSIDGATTVAGVNQETAKATELNNAMHSLQNGINDETQTKQTQKYLDAEPSKKSAYDQAVNAAKAILTKASGQNVDKAAVEQALQNVNSTKTALNGDAKLNEAKAAAKQTLGTLTHINNAQRTALDNEITQATNVEGVNTVKAKAQQLDGAMGQLETSIRDKDTTLQSQNYQDADDAKRTAYSQAVNAAATILNKTAGGNTPKADVERAMQAVTQANTALNGIQNLERAKQAANTAITNASDLNTKQKEALKAQVTSAGRVSAANGVEHTATELNTAMTALKRAIADKAETKASGNYVNVDANKRQAYDEKVTAAENIVSGTPTPTLTPSDVTNAATQVTNAKTQLNGNHNLEVAKQNANTAIDGLTSLNGPQKAKLKEQVGQATTLPNVQTVRDNAQTLNTAMKGLRESIANEATIKADQNYTDASQSKQTDYNNAVTAAKAIIGQTTSPTMNAQEINQAKDQVTAKQQALNGQENLRTAQTNAKQHLNGLSDLTNAQKEAAKRQIEGATHVNEVTQAQNNADALNTAMTNLKNGIQDQNTIKRGVNFTDADEAKRNAYTNAVTQAEQILNKAQGPNTAKDGVETALQNVQRAKNDLNGNQNVANAKTTAKNALNNLTSINNAQKEALKSQIEGATTVAGVNQVSTTASELNTAMSNLQRGINDEAATKAAQKYTDADREKQTAYNDAVTAAKTLLNKTAGSNDNKAAVEQALQRVNTAKNALNGDARLNEAKKTAKQQLATMSHLTDAQKANLTSQIERGTTVAGVQGIQANAGTLNQAMNQLRQSIASKDATKSSEDYQDANTDLQNAYNRAVSDAEGIISATNNPEMNPDTINQKASQVNSAKSALNGDEKLAAAKQTAKTDIGRLTDLNNAQRTAANAEVDQAPNLAAVTAAKNKATSLNTAMGNLKHALAEKDNTKRSVNYTDADRPKQQAYDTAVTQAEAITNANGSNANETQVQAALNQLNQAKNDLNGDNKVAQAKEAAKRALASYNNLNNAQSIAATSQIDNATTVAGVTAAQNTANELNTAMGQLQNSINDQNTVKQQVNFTDADQGKKDAYTNAVTNAQGILDKAHGQNMTKAQVEAALNQVTTAKNALNGDANVRQAKSDAKANLGTLTHLNNAQKQDLTSQIEGATTVNGVNGVKTKAQDLDGAMQRLESAIANKDQTRASENYIDADPTKKTAFDNAITQAESYLNKDHGANKDKQAVEQAIQSVTTAKNALNGDANLQRAKTEATQAIDNLTHLNTPQKTALKQQVNAAQRVSGVTDLKNSATSLNNAMDQLKQAIADHDTIVAGGNYTNASPDKQGAYTDAYNAAKNIVNGSPNVVTNAADVTAATQRVNNAETGLNGDSNLATAKQQAKDALRQMTHLSAAQKQSITGQIDSATQVTGVQSVKDNATNLDNAMNQLRNSIANKDEVKASQPYVDADTDKQNAYNTAVTSAENIINATSQPTLDPSAVTQAANQVNTNKTALNGVQNLANKKQETTANINQLSHLNNAQKQDLNTQVTNAPNISTVNQVKTKAEQLDQAMERLINGIQDKDQVKQSVNFTDADPEKQTAYNNAVAHAEQIISGTPNANVDPQQVAQALQQVTQAKGDLNGNHNLQVAKDNANTAIDQLPNLNQPQKTALKDQVSHAELVTGVNAIKQNADALNNAMGTLKQQIQANSQVPQSVDFTQADQDKQQAYNNAANQAQQIANGTPTPVLSPDTVTQAVTTMNQAKDALNGDEKLAQAKQDALANLDTLRDLNQPQRDALRNQINQAQALATVEQTKQNAQNVNATMGNLKQGIANKDTVKASENYHDADADKQTAYTNAVSQAEGIINQTTNPTLNPDEITRALTQVTDAKNGLNGEAKLATEKQNAKDAVSGMTHLNDAQKQALKGQIDQSPEIATVNQVKQTATSLDHAMDQLSQAINDKAQTLADGNYLNADPDKQNAYKQAVAKAEALLNKQSGTNEVQAQVESITNEVKTAKQALNGNDNLANAKQQAKQQLANLTHLNDAQKQSFENQITQAPLVTDVTTINQKAQTLDHAMELLRNSIADNQATLASEDYHDATAQRQNDYNQAVTAANNIINQTTSPTMNPDDVNRATTQVNNTKVALDGDENLVAAKQQANNRLDQLDHLNNAQKQQLQSQITQSSDIAAVNGHKQTAESLNTAMGNLINAIADHQAVEQRGNFINADTDKQTAYTTAVNEAEAMINKQTGQNANQTEVEQAITKVQTTLQALNGDHNLQVAKTNATQAIDALTSLNDPQKTALKDQVTAATLVTAVHQIEQTANTLNQAMHGLRESIQDNATTQANSKYINEDQPEQQNYDQAVQAANNIINEQTATLDNNAINQAATTVNTTKAALHGDVKLQNDKDRAKQTVSQLAHLNNAQKHMEDTLIDSETTRTAVNHDLTEAQALDQLMDTLQQSIADKDATRASSAYVNAEPNKKQAYDEAVQNAESIIAGLTNPTINKGNVSSATQAVTSSKNALDGVERLAQDKQTAGNSLNHLDQLTPAQQQALENQINNATTRDKVAEIIAQAQALNEAMKALKESIKDQPQTEASSKFINEDQAQKDAYTQAVQHAKDLINKTTDPTLAKSIIDQATQAVTDAKNNLHGDQKLAQDKQRATETLNNLSNLNTPQRQALENQINNAATR